MSLFTIGRLFDTLSEWNYVIASRVRNAFCDLNEKYVETT